MMATTKYAGVLRMACLLALTALGLMVWSLFDPRWLPVIVAMSLGQVFGTLSLVAFLVVVVADVRRTRARAMANDAAVAPPP